MSWRDFFYFSKGERSGLIVLLCLITVAGILLILSDKQAIIEDSGTTQTNVDRNLNTAAVSDNTPSQKNVSSDEGTTSGNKVTASPTGVRNSSSPVAAESSSPTSTNTVTKQPEEKESVAERVNRLTSYSRPSYPRTEKFDKGTVVELNTADTTILKKVPGIGSAYAKRIVSYRNLLGGYYSVTQLSEVYGIDEDRYNDLAPWFSADPSLISVISVNTASQDSLNRHPYLNYSQTKVIIQLRKQKGKLTDWDNLRLLDEFTDLDKIRLQHYLSFE